MWLIVQFLLRRVEYIVRKETEKGGRKYSMGYLYKTTILTFKLISVMVNNIVISVNRFNGTPSRQ